MKIAIVSESSGDDLIVRILCERVLGFPIEFADRRRAAGGYIAAKNSIKAAYRHLHYRRDAQALIVCLDADNSVPHSSGCAQAKCRHCEIQALLEEEQRTVKPFAAYSAPIDFFIAVPPPSIEAWLMAHRDNNCSEALWSEQQKSRPDAVNAIIRLKVELYGKRHASDAERAAAATAAAANIALIESSYPNSFGQLARALRARFGVA